MKSRLKQGLCAFEFMSGRFVELAARLAGQEAPLGSSASWHVLIEAAGSTGESTEDVLQSVLAEALDRSLIDGCVLAAVLAHGGTFWRLRESIPEELTHLKPTVALDIGRPWSETADYITEVEAALKRQHSAAEHIFLSHLGDNNLHLISGPVDVQALDEVDEIVYGARRGTVSAEHGVGCLKKPYLGVTRSPELIDLMRRLKAALDPTRMLHPGRIFDEQSAN